MISLDLVAVPEGDCQLGLDALAAAKLALGTNEFFDHLDERCERVNAFAIQRNPVTCKQYEQFLTDFESVVAPPGWRGRRSAPRGCHSKPVTGVTHHEASCFADWAGVRLPTELEWEYAMRGSDGRRFPWGNDPTKLFHSSKLPRAGARPDLSSPFGVEDGLGVIDEWTSTTQDRFVIARGCPYRMKIFHCARRFALIPSDRWSITGFRCAK